ncbi:MAG: PilN domain-containing protein [Sedimentisphaerales bacterium]|nr:PilN domain-containing protein [Sedimentisphaerales bacterium]
MVKRCIGIDMTSSYVCAVQIARDLDQFCLEKVFTAQIRRKKDSPSEKLRSLTSQHGFDHRADVAMGIPHDGAFFTNVEIDSTTLEQIHKGEMSALEHSFPVKPDEIIAQPYSYRQLPDEKYSALTVALTKKSLRERLNVLAEGKMYPKLVDADIFAIYATIVTNHPEIAVGLAIIVYINTSYLTFAVTKDNDILIVRNIPIVSRSQNDAGLAQQQLIETFSREARITWWKVLGTEIEQNTKIYLVVQGQTPNELQTAIEQCLCCETIIVNPYARVKSTAGDNGHAQVCVAQGLALRLLAPEKNVGVNFLNVDNRSEKQALNLRKELTTLGILIAAIVVVSPIGLFMRLAHLETKYRNIRNEIRQTFVHVLPEEKNIVNPLAQLEQKWQILRKTYMLFAPISESGVGPLEILRAITISIPQQANISINNILIDTESVRLKGIAQSFESVYDWQQQLQKASQFSSVDVQDIRREPKNESVHFTIFMLLEMSEQK